MMEWAKELKMAITVCDLEGNIVYMNEQSIKTFQKPGIPPLLGSNLFDCHPEKAQSKIRELMKSGESNTYTIEKSGKKKLIYQTPWKKDGQVKGMVECSFEIPFELPHFIRKSSTK
ncbi:MAG: PAS sensor protein [Caldisericia bacterium]|nr:PAS sensor protein [Caldisericia bacterium]